MSILKIAVSALLVCLITTLCSAEEVMLKIKSLTSIAKTDDHFVCATVDWWPITKCDYNQCPWGNAGLPYLDLKNKILSNAIKAFGNLRVRVGGSLQDQVLYNVGGIEKCPHFERTDDGMFGFSQGCLEMKRWDEVNQLFNETGAIVTFGLNALFGKRRPKGGDTVWLGDWNPYNTRDLMNYTITNGYKIDSYEFGNELCGSGVDARVDAKQYAKDFVALKNLVRELHPYEALQPKIMGPAGYFDEKWFTTFLQATGPLVVDGVTHHIYNLGSGVDSDLINKVQDPYFLNQVAQTYTDIARIIENYTPWTEAWVGESGGAFNSGGRDVSNTFANGFWYLDQLGMTSTISHKVFCRQSLIGGNYALLNTTTFIPNPDFYGALLWHRLMGKNVLQTTHNASAYLRAYTHCSKNATGITVLMINMSNSTLYNVSVFNDMILIPGLVKVKRDTDQDDAEQKEEYHLTPEGGNIQSDVILLNGEALKLTESLDIPVLKPKLTDSELPIHVAPHSFVFVNLKGFIAPACTFCLDGSCAVSSL